MTNKWQFPAWEEMKEIDITKPLVTRGGKVVNVHVRKGTPCPVYVYECFNTDINTLYTVTRYGREYAGKPPHDKSGDIQNPPEWAYAQYGIEPQQDSESELDITVSVAIQHSAQCVDLVDQLATEPCRAPSYDLWQGKDTPCGKCASCRARAINGGEMPQLRRRGDGTSYRCQVCGQSEV